MVRRLSDDAQAVKDNAGIVLGGQQLQEVAVSVPKVVVTVRLDQRRVRGNRTSSPSRRPRRRECSPQIASAYIDNACSGLEQRCPVQVRLTVVVEPACRVSLPLGPACRTNWASAAVLAERQQCKLIKQGEHAPHEAVAHWHRTPRSKSHASYRRTQPISIRFTASEPYMPDWRSSRARVTGRSPRRDSPPERARRRTAAR